MSRANVRNISDFDSKEIKLNGLLLLHSSRLKKKAWIVVEGVDDRQLFEMLIPSNELYISDSAVRLDGTGNCENVRFIVEQLRTKANEVPVVGIRDRDHLTFVKNKCHKSWKNILFTDKRDMENMIFSSSKTVQMVETLHSGFTRKLDTVKCVTRPMGVLRVINSINGHGVDMKVILSPDNTMQRQGIVWKRTDWKKLLIDLYNTGLPRKNQNKRKRLTRKKFDKQEKSMSSFADDMVCQGHDIVRYLYHSQPFSANVCQKDFYSLLFKAYSVSGDFRNTSLYINLRKWLSDKAGIQI